MKKMGKKITCAILAATMLATAFTGCGKEEKLDGTQTVMTIGEEKVTLGLAHLMLRKPGSFRRLYGYIGFRLWWNRG